MTDKPKYVEVARDEIHQLCGIEIQHLGLGTYAAFIDSDGSIGLGSMPRWRVRAMPRDNDAFVEQLQSGIPESWGSSEGSPESICVDYVREIERRLIARGGTLERSEEA